MSTIYWLSGLWACESVSMLWLLITATRVCLRLSYVKELDLAYCVWIETSFSKSNSSLFRLSFRLTENTNVWCNDFIYLNYTEPRPWWISDIYFIRKHVILNDEISTFFGDDSARFGVWQKKSLVLPGWQGTKSSPTGRVSTGQMILEPGRCRGGWRGLKL